MDLESEIDKLVTSGVKNQTQTLNLSRLMVRAEDFETRRNILSILRNAEQACRYCFSFKNCYHSSFNSSSMIF